MIWDALKFCSGFGRPNLGVVKETHEPGPWAMFNSKGRRRLGSRPSRTSSSEFRVQSSDVQSSEFRVQSSDVQSSEFRLQTSDFRLQTFRRSDVQTFRRSDFRRSEFRVQSSDVDVRVER